MQDAGYKECTGCREAKPYESFHRNRRNKADGRQNRCKTCRASEVKAWNERNKERAAANAKRWAEENPEKRREISRRYAQRNPEKVAHRTRVYRETHRAQKAQSAREFRKQNPERVAEWEARARNRSPEKTQARFLVQRAVSNGKLVKPECCEDCGKTVPKRGLHGHHEDYSKPLDVEWLCPACHTKRHPRKDR